MKKSFELSVKQPKKSAYYHSKAASILEQIELLNNRRAKMGW